MARLTKIQARRGTAAAWITTNPVLAVGEPGYETDTGLLKLGDGATAWTILPYIQRPGHAYTPPSGCWMFSPTATAVGSNTPPSGRVTFSALDVPMRPLTIQALGCSVNTALVGGTVVATIGLYPDDGSGGLPDCTRLLVSGAVSLTSTGKKTVASSLTLPAGKYWGAFFYSASVAPTTAPQVSGVVTGLRTWASDANWDIVQRAPFLASETALPTTARAASLFDTTPFPVVVALRAA